MKSLVLCLLLSFSSIVYGSTAIYSCDIKILNKNFVGWIPYSFQVTFYDNGARAKVGYGHDFETIALGRYSSTYKELTGKITLTTTANKKYETRHAITIFKDNKIIYDFSTVGADHAYVAYGKCTMPTVSAATKSSSSPASAKKSGSCSLKSAVCTNVQLCGKAIAISNGIKIWETRTMYLPHVREAKRRGLTCGTKPTISTTNAKKSGSCSLRPAACTDIQLCGKAIAISNGIKVWEIRKTYLPHVREAKRRGLICGTKSSNSTIQKTQSSTPCGPSMSKCAKLSGFQITLLVKGHTLEGNYLLGSTNHFKEVYADNGIYSMFINNVYKPELGYKWRVSNDDKLCYSHADGEGCASIYTKWDSGNKKWLYFFYSEVDNEIFAEITSSTAIESPSIPKQAPQEKKIIKKPVQPLESLINPLHFKKYGKAFHTPLLSNVIFFIGEIEDNDERGLRRALRSHDVDTVALVSPGGLIYTGLELANIIYDNNLTTYVPLGQACASSCSFMFFAGKSKVAHGRLGVHQFYVDDDKKKVAIGKAQRGTQYTVADIIQTLTDFGTPASVFPKMFSTSGMYYFSEEEKDSFSNSDAIKSDTVTIMSQVLEYFTKYVDDELDDTVLNKMPEGIKNTLLQLELIRIGCMKGPADGISGERTISAIQQLSAKTDTDLSTDLFSNLFRSINKTDAGACY
jgi:hypothetical protein